MISQQCIGNEVEGNAVRHFPFICCRGSDIAQEDLNDFSRRSFRNLKPIIPEYRPETLTS